MLYRKFQLIVGATTTMILLVLCRSAAASKYTFEFKAKENCLGFLGECPKRVNYKFHKDDARCKRCITKFVTSYLKEMERQKSNQRSRGRCVATSTVPRFVEEDEARYIARFCTLCLTTNHLLKKKLLLEVKKNVAKVKGTELYPYRKTVRKGRRPDGAVRKRENRSPHDPRSEGSATPKKKTISSFDALCERMKQEAQNRLNETLNGNEGLSYYYADQDKNKEADDAMHDSDYDDEWIQLSAGKDLLDGIDIPEPPSAQAP